MLSADDPALRALRNALGEYPTGVAIATTRTPAGPVGVTVNSFGSLSLDPPLVLWCLRRGSVRLPDFTAAENFAISVLAAGQEQVARQFAVRTPPDTPLARQQFAAGDWHEDPHGLPVLAGAVAAFACRRATQLPGGDHVIIIGELLDFQVIAQRGGSGREAPLIFHGGRYNSLAATAAGAAIGS
jgi:flavin reductase (DIM6/NTAB) family NADH-FMN oxidoreductase RutF